jgi:hypothetical protein
MNFPDRKIDTVDLIYKLICVHLNDSIQKELKKDKDLYVLNQSEMLNKSLRLADFKDLEEVPTEKIHITIRDKISLEFLKVEVILKYCQFKNLKRISLL